MKTNPISKNLQCLKNKYHVLPPYDVYAKPPVALYTTTMETNTKKKMTAQIRVSPSRLICFFKNPIYNVLTIDLNSYPLCS